MGRRWLCSFAALLFTGSVLSAQNAWTLRTYGGIDIGAASMPGLADHANILGGPSGKRIEDFQSLFGLSGGVEVQVVDGWSVGVDFIAASRTIQTNPDVPSAGWTFEPAVRMPTVVIRRIYDAGSLSYGFGGGVGYHAGSLTATPPGLVVGTTYEGSGIGLLGQAIAFTAFGDSFHGMIAVDVRWSGISKLTDANGREPVTGNGVKATLETFAVALRFGLAFQL